MESRQSTPAKTMQQEHQQHKVKVQKCVAACCLIAMCYVFVGYVDVIIIIDDQQNKQTNKQVKFKIKQRKRDEL